MHNETDSRLQPGSPGLPLTDPTRPRTRIVPLLRRRWRAALPVAAVSAALLLGACSAGTNKASRTGPSDAATATSSGASTVVASGAPTGGCPSVPEVDAAMGGAYHLQNSQRFGAGVECALDSGAGTLVVDINPHSYGQSAVSPALRHVATAVPGVGDWAYWAPAADVFYAGRGSTSLTIEWGSDGGAVPPLSGFTNLARQLL
jgi:hypothetical protein